MSIADCTEQFKQTAGLKHHNNLSNIYNWGSGSAGHEHGSQTHREAHEGFNRETLLYYGTDNENHFFRILPNPLPILTNGRDH